jgi:TetR/AcrR family transcriptional repressor of bet genes
MRAGHGRDKTRVPRLKTALERLNKRLRVRRSRNALDTRSLFYIITIMPKKVDHAARKTEIANAALEAIAERGLDDVRMVDIARATEATTGRLVHYFPDKDAMLLAALDEIMVRLLARSSAKASRRDTISEIAEALPLDAQSRRDWRIWLQFWGRAMHNPTFGPRHEDYYRQITGALSARLREYATSAKADALADAIVAAVDGIGARATLEPNAWPPARQKRLLTQMLGPLFDAAGLGGAQPTRKG